MRELTGFFIIFFLNFKIKFLNFKIFFTNFKKIFNKKVCPLFTFEVITKKSIIQTFDAKKYLFFLSYINVKKNLTLLLFLTRKILSLRYSGKMSTLRPLFFLDRTKHNVIKTMKIGQAIKEIRMRKKIPQEYFAKKICGVSTVTLRAIESGVRDPSRKIVDAIQKNLGIPYSYILLYSLTEDDVEIEKIPMVNATREALMESIGKPYVLPEEFQKKKRRGVLRKTEKALTTGA